MPRLIRLEIIAMIPDGVRVSEFVENVDIQVNWTDQDGKTTDAYQEMRETELIHDGE